MVEIGVQIDWINDFYGKSWIAHFVASWEFVFVAAVGPLGQNECAWKIEKPFFSI